MDRLLKVDPQSQRAWLFRGMFLLQERKFSEAGEALEKAQAKVPSPRTSWAALDFLRIAERKPAEALKGFRRRSENRSERRQSLEQCAALLSVRRAMSRAESSRDNMPSGSTRTMSSISRREVMTWLSAAARWEDTEKEAREVIAPAA